MELSPGDSAPPRAPGGIAFRCCNLQAHRIFLAPAPTSASRSTKAAFALRVLRRALDIEFRDCSYPREDRLWLRLLLRATLGQ